MNSNLLNEQEKYKAHIIFIESIFSLRLSVLSSLPKAQLKETHLGTKTKKECIKEKKLFSKIK